MSRSPFFGIVCGAIGVLLLWKANSSDVGPQPPAPQPSRDLVAASFDLYERLWHKLLRRRPKRLSKGRLQQKTKYGKLWLTDKAIFANKRLTGSHKKSSNFLLTLEVGQQHVTQLY